MKGVLKNTAMFAKVALADILETVRRFFTSLRYVQNDRLLPPISLENLKSKNLGKTVVILKREALKNLLMVSRISARALQCLSNIAVSSRRCFTPFRFVQHDNILSRFAEALFRTSE